MRSTPHGMAALALSCVLVGCTGVPDDPGGDGTEDGADGKGDPGDAPGTGGDGQANDPIEGTYDVTTTYDAPSSSLLTGLLITALSVLDELAADPAGTLIDLLDRANVPILDQLLALLEPLLLDSLNDFINEFVVSRLVEGIPVPDQLNDLVGSLIGLLTSFDLLSQLDLRTLRSSGTASADHRLSALAFSWQGDRLLADTPEIVDRLTGAQGVSCDVSMSGDDGEIAFGDHAFDVPYSDLGVVALNQALSQTFGAADLRAALGQLFDCPALAVDVASQCLVPLVLCVGHQEELEQLCESGLDQVVAQVEDRLRVLDFASMRFDAGRALLRGDDGLVESFEGTWQTTVEIDGTQLSLPASFVARRVE